MPNDPRKQLEEIKNTRYKWNIILGEDCVDYNMPNNQQKEEVKCERCRDTKKDSCGFLCWDCSKPESMVTTCPDCKAELPHARCPATEPNFYSMPTLDRKLRNQLVKFYWVQCQVDGKTNWDLVDDTEDFSIIPTNSKGKIQLEVGELRDIIAEASKVFRADEARVVRAECAEIVDKIEKRIEGDRTVQLGFVLSEINEAKSKILNNSSL